MIQGLAGIILSLILFLPTAFVVRQHSETLYAHQQMLDYLIAHPDTDLRKVECVPMQYLVRNKPIPKIHSYSKPLTVCEDLKP